MDKQYQSAEFSMHKTAPRIIMISFNWSSLSEFLVLSSSLDLPYTDIVIVMSSNFYHPAGNMNHQTEMRIDGTAGITPQGNFVLEMTATAYWPWSVKSKFFNFVAIIIFLNLAVMHDLFRGFSACTSFNFKVLSECQILHKQLDQTGKHLAIGILRFVF